MSLGKTFYPHCSTAEVGDALLKKLSFTPFISISPQIISLGLDLGNIPEVNQEVMEMSHDMRTESCPGVGGAKRRKVVSSTVRAEYDLELKKMNEWFEKIESGLELLTQDQTSPQDQFTEEEQVVLIEVCSSDNEEKDLITLCRLYSM